jgi:hypothetical protein
MIGATFPTLSPAAPNCRRAEIKYCK